MIVEASMIHEGIREREMSRIKICRRQIVKFYADMWKITPIVLSGTNFQVNIQDCVVSVAITGYDGGVVEEYVIRWWTETILRTMKI